MANPRLPEGTPFQEPFTHSPELRDSLNSLMPEISRRYMRSVTLGFEPTAIAKDGGVATIVVRISETGLYEVTSLEVLLGENDAVWGHERYCEIHHETGEVVLYDEKIGEFDDEGNIQDPTHLGIPWEIFSKVKMRDYMDLPEDLPEPTPEAMAEVKAILEEAEKTNAEARTRQFGVEAIVHQLENLA